MFNNNYKICAFLMSLFVVGQIYVSGGELGFFFSKINVLIHFLKKLFLLCARSYVWKTLRDFKQTRDMIFLTSEYET